MVRLCHLLLEVFHLTGGLVLLPQFFTYEEMAKYLGCHPVTISRITAKRNSRVMFKKPGRDCP